MCPLFLEDFINVKLRRTIVYVRHGPNNFNPNCRLLLKIDL
jgi:hypothetical protein